MNLTKTKSILYQQCLDWIETKIGIASKAMQDAQESANNEEKSSAGDKYETGRAMSQNERDMYAKQLAECLKQKQLLQNIDISQNFTKAVPGAIVLTETANYFITISAGNIVADGQSFFVVSPETPIAKVLLNKQAGDSFSFNGKEVKIKSIQ